MAKVVIAKLKQEPKRSVGGRLVRGADGHTRKMPTLDAASPSFGDDLHSVFAKNVRKARRDNKRIVGSADIAPRKA